MRPALLLTFFAFIASCGSDATSTGGDTCPLECGAHEVCDSGVSGAECVCAAGYEGDPCTWGTVPDDPEFATPDTWSDEDSGVTILPTVPGLGPGLVWLDESALCNGGMVSQVVEMPDREVAEPFVFEMTYRSDLVNGVEVYAGRALRTVKHVGVSFVTERFCLGEAAYGGSVKFRIGASERDAKCETESQGLIEVDRFSILPARTGECPEPGFALNGEANPEEGAWWLDDEHVRPVDGVATVALEPGVGRGGTAGARMYQDGGGNLVSMGTQISVPLSSSASSGPALRFWWKGDGLEVFPRFGTPRDNFAENPLEILSGHGEEQVNTYCLPPWTYGSVVELWFVPLGGRSAGEFVVDDIEVVPADPHCPVSRDILDPHFDSAPNHWPGHIWGGPIVDVPIEIRDDPQGGSPSGGGAIVLSYAGSDAFIQFHNWVWVPEVETGDWPVLAFYSKLPSNPGLRVAGLISRTSEATEKDHLAPGAGWQRNEYCLPRGWSGRWLRFRVEAKRGAPPFQAFDPPKEIWLDDFQTTTSPGCPE